MDSMPEDIEFLEEEKLDANISFAQRGRQDLLNESEMGIPICHDTYVATAPAQDFKNISIGEPQKCRDGRESYYAYPIYIESQLVSQRRYNEFAWLRNQLLSKYPGCIIQALPDKEGITGYWTSQDPMFYEFRRYGLEKFIQRIGNHQILGRCIDFLSFIKDDELNFTIRLRESQIAKGWMSKITDFSSSFSSIISNYVQRDHIILQNDADIAFNYYRTELKNLLQQQENLRANSNKITLSLESEINSSLVMSKAYESMSKIEKENASAKLKILAATHQQIAESQRKSYNKIKSLSGKEIEDYYKLTIGAFEAIERRNRIRSENSDADVDIDELNETLKEDMENFYKEKNSLAKAIGKYMISYKKEMTEMLADIWKESYSRLSE